MEPELFANRVFEDLEAKGADIKFGKVKSRFASSAPSFMEELRRFPKVRIKSSIAKEANKKDKIFNILSMVGSI